MPFLGDMLVPRRVYVLLIGDTSSNGWAFPFFGVSFERWFSIRQVSKCHRFTNSGFFRLNQQFEFTKVCRKIGIPSLKLTARTWKWMVGILDSFWDGPISGAMLVSGMVPYHFKIHTPHAKMEFNEGHNDKKPKKPTLKLIRTMSSREMFVTMTWKKKSRGNCW